MKKNSEYNGVIIFTLLNWFFYFFEIHIGTHGDLILSRSSNVFHQKKFLVFTQ